MKTVKILLVAILLLAIPVIVFAQDDCESSSCESPPPGIWTDGQGCLSVFVFGSFGGVGLYFEKKGKHNGV